MMYRSRFAAGGFVLPSDTDAAPVSGEPVVAKPFTLPSDADTQPTENGAPQGPLSNAPDDTMTSSLAKGAATAGIKGASDAAGIFGGAMDLGDYLYAKGKSIVTGRPLEDIQKEIQQEEADEAKDSWLPDPRSFMPSPQEVAAPVLKRTGEYVPTTEPGRLLQSGAEAVAAGALMNPAAIATAAGPRAALAAAGAEAVPNFVGGVAAQGATDLTGSPLAGLAAGIGGAGVAGKAGVGLLSSENRQIAVGQKLLGAAENPEAFKQSLDSQPAELVPGAKPTTFQQTGDMGVGALERDVKTAAPVPFLNRAAEQNSARVTALNSIEPTGAPQDLSSFVTGRLQQIDNVGQKYADAAASDARSSSSGIGQGQSPEFYGNAMRGTLQDARDAARQHEGALQEAVDPNKTLAVTSTPILQAEQAIYGDLPRAAAANLSPEEQSFRSIVQGFAPVERYREVASLRTQLADAMRQERSNNGLTPAYARMSQLMNGVQDVIKNGVEDKAAQDARAVASGSMAPEDSIQGRLVRFADNDAAARSSTVATGRAGYGANSGRLSDSFPGVNGGASQASGGPGMPAGNSGLSAGASANQGSAVRSSQAAGRKLGVAPPPAAVKEFSLLEHLRTMGGLKPNSELGAIFGGRPPPGLIKPNGMTLDQAREAATEAGYIHDPGAEYGAGPLQTDTNTLLDKIAAEHGGQKQYRLSADPGAYAGPMQARQSERNLRSALSEAGIDPNRQPRHVIDSAVDMLTSGEETDPILAHQRAVMRDNLDPGAPPLKSSAKVAPVSAQPVRPLLKPNWDQAAADREALASAATRNRVATFDKGTVGKILAPGPTKGTYKLTSDALVPSKVFVSGPTGAEAVAAYRKAGATKPGTEQILQDHVADSLRREAVGQDGLVDPQKYAKWAKNYDSALGALPKELTDKFSTAAKATQTMGDVAALRKQAVETYQKGVFGKLIGVNDPTTVSRTVGHIFGSADAVPQMQRLVAEARRDPQAMAGLRKAIVDHVTNKFIGNTEAGTSEQAAIKADGFQTFVRQNASVLRQAFPGEEMNTFNAIARSLQQSARTAKIPGQSNTAQDLIPHLKRAAEGHDESMLSKIAKAAFVGKEAVGALVGEEHHGLGVGVGTGLAIGKQLISAMREAGMHKVADLVKEALLNPDLARTLVQKASKVPDRGIEVTLARQLRRLSAFAPIALRPQNAR